jgi:CDP-2,3-bis-(O-geranylgeranyl)-sn-glycerol synthase
MIILDCLYFMMPAYIANMIPVFSAKLFPNLNLPIDLDFKIGDKPILGKNKTFRGLLSGTLFGVLVFYIQKIININSLIDYSQSSLMIGLTLSLGALLGDLFGSLLKRRWNINPGKPLYIVDQLDYSVGALFITSFIIDFSIQQIFIILTLSLGLTILVNHFAYFLSIRKEKW